VAISDQLQIKLAFKDSPTTGDDFINLNFLKQPDPSIPGSTGVGYVLRQGGYSEGQPYLDGNNRLVRDITITLDIEGTSRDDAVAKLRNLKRFISRTRSYFAQFGGNPPARSDAKGHQGQAAVLTIQAPNATNELYWDVIGGPDPQLPSLAGALTKASFDNVQVTFTVDAWARGARVVLDNLIDSGDFASPYNITSFNGNLDGNWTYPNTTDWTLPPSPVQTFGIQSLRWSATSSTTATSNEATEFKTGDVIVPAIWIYFTGSTVSGTLTVKLQGWNGSAWVDKLTIASVTGAVTATTWARYTNGSYTVESGITKLRLSITSPNTNVSASACYFNGVAMWRNPTGGTVPTEYLGSGRTVGMPQCNVYNIQGDVPAPIMMRIMDGPAGVDDTIFVAGGMAQDLGTVTNRLEYPLFGMDMRPAATGTSSAVIFGGSLPTEQTGAGTTSTATTTNLIVGTLDRRPRLYRAFLIYALNDAVTVSSVKLSIPLNSTSNVESKTFTVALPNTYTGTGTIAAGNFRAYELGDFQFSRNGVSWEENTQSWISSSTFITITHNSSANRHCSIAGIILLPADQYVSVNTNTSLHPTTNSGVDILNEGTAPRIAVQVSSIGAGGSTFKIYRLNWRAGIAQPVSPEVICIWNPQTMGTIPGQPRPCGMRC
jgi:hypothetical protein